MDHSNLLRQIPLFESMEDADVTALGKKLTPKTFAEGDVVFIEWTASATLGTGTLRWSGVDRFLLGADGRALERVAWFDPAPLLVAILRHPSCWWRFVRSGVARRALQNGTGTSTRR